MLHNMHVTFNGVLKLRYQSQGLVTVNLIVLFLNIKLINRINEFIVK